MYFRQPFAKPVLWDSFKNLLGWAFKQQNIKWKRITEKLNLV